MAESNDPWKLKEFYILSSERNFSLLRKKTIPKKNNDVGRDIKVKDV